LGVIPCTSAENFILRKNYSFLPVLRSGIKNNSLEVALHGLTHQKMLHGEFSNLPLIEQNRRISKGKLFLDSILQTNVVTFIPPFNAYDVNTLKALENNGIKAISSALCVGQSVSDQPMLFAPETMEDFGTLLSVLNKNKNRKGVVVVMFHDYTFKNDFKLQDLDRILKSVNQLKYVKCYSFKGLLESKEIIDRKRINANLESNLLYKKFHLEGMIQTTLFSNLIRIANLFLYLFLSIFAFLSSDKFVMKDRKIRKQTKISAVVPLMLITGFLVWFHVFAPNKLIVGVVSISIIEVLFIKLLVVLQPKNRIK
jgi:predicted deacetylase